MSPSFWRRFHLALTLGFGIMVPITFITGLQDSLPYVVFLSLWALIASHWAAWQAARVEVKQDAQQE